MFMDAHVLSEYALQYWRVRDNMHAIAAGRIIIRISRY
jgi:hypothetical protein